LRNIELFDRATMSSCSMASSDGERTPDGGFGEILRQLLARQELSAAQTERVIQSLITLEAGDVESAAVLTAWAAKGETAGELASAALVLRGAMIRLEAGLELLLDTCGTGGDGTGTFNISTASAIVAAAAGVPVVKHGNRAVTSRSGASDLLTALGVKLLPGPEWPRQTLARTGMAFCFAPEFHPALANLAPLRKRLGIRTIFNCLGPLANPAGADCQVIGVGSPALLEAMSGALARLGSRHSFVVHGGDGLDEVTLTGPTFVREIAGGRIQELTWHPADFGLSACHLHDLAAPTPEESARIVMGVLGGQKGPCRDIVLANTAAALLAADRTASLAGGVELAAKAIDSGRAVQVLEALKSA
jgi:anthranilate phosphoribosyltransferase